MPKIIFENNEKDRIPEDLQSKAVEVDGKFELDASGVLNKNAELLSKTVNYKTQVDDLTKQVSELLQEKTRLETSKMPDGKVAVDPEIEKLGLAAKEAGLKQTELPKLKSQIVELQNQQSEITRDANISKAADKLGFNKKFVALAKTNGLNFEIEETGEGEDKKSVVLFVDAKGEKKTKEEFFKENELFANFADSFGAETKEDSKGFRFPDESKGSDTKPSVKTETEAARATGIYAL